MECKSDFNSKDEVYFRICNAVLKLEVIKGNLKWKISDVAREADVTRSLIYYYFGKEREVILRESWGYMLSTIFNLSGAEPLGVRRRMELVCSQIREMPYLFVLFFLEKHQDSEIGELIRKGEQALLTKIAQIYPDLSSQEILKIYLLELGVVAHGALNKDQFSELFPE